MERIKGLNEYVKNEKYRKALNLPNEQEEEYTMLAQGEYNINYSFTHPKTGKKLLLRVNCGSQMHLENQIEYEYHALELLADSGRTPVPVFVDGSKKELPYGVMVMEFLEGSALDYRKNLMEAAECLADIHSVPVKETDGLISPSNPLQAILDECNQMVQTYYESDLGEEKKKVQIRRLLELGQEKINEIRDYSGYRCCINTELNSGNFLMNGAGKDNYLVDWEKPLYGDPVQDLGHFLAPTTTFWKTDVILTEEEMASLGFHREEDVLVDFEVGDMVVVISGAWKDTVGAIKAINDSKKTITMHVEMFGRETPVELSFSEIKKM